jgi:hypothetical protein
MWYSTKNTGGSSSTNTFNVWVRLQNESSHSTSYSTSEDVLDESKKGPDLAGTTLQVEADYSVRPLQVEDLHLTAGSLEEEGVDFWWQCVLP